MQTKLGFLPAKKQGEWLLTGQSIRVCCGPSSSIIVPPLFGHSSHCDFCFVTCGVECLVSVSSGSSRGLYLFPSHFCPQHCALHIVGTPQFLTQIYSYPRAVFLNGIASQTIFWCVHVDYVCGIVPVFCPLDVSSHPCHWDNLKTSSDTSKPLQKGQHCPQWFLSQF